MPRRLCFRIVALLVFGGVLTKAAPPYKERWVSKYFYDEDNSSLVITDFQFATAKRGIASGYITKSNSKDKPVMLVTSDAGEHWTVVPVKEVPRSVFLLADGTGWMIGDKDLWRTEEGGRSWQKVKDAPKDLVRVWFNTRDRGWAVGEHKQVFQTTNGGTSWTPVEAAAKPKVNPETTIYNVISFANGTDGIIAGFNNPPRREPLPDWVDPAKAKERPQWPTALALLQTRDGGTTWDASTTSIFGEVTRISQAPDGRALLVVEFVDSFAYPSEVHLANGHNSGKSERVFRQANRFITDAAFTPAGTGYLVGPEATGTVRHSPIPGKLKVLKSTDFQHWTEMPVDYRTDAHRAMITAPDDENVWVATDTGMILKLVREP